MTAAAASFFLGFGTLEALLNSHDPAKPIYLEALNRSIGGHPVERRERVVMVCDVQDGVCRYWRMRTSVTELVHGELFGGSKTEEDLKVARAEGVLKILERVIRQVHRFRIESAVVAVPRDLQLLNGTANCMRFEEKTGLFVDA